MKVLYYQVLLEKNEHFSQPCWIYPWELPVFAAAHRKSAVTEIGKGVFNKRFAPHAEAEYDRLGLKYRGPEGSDMTYVSTVYGHGSLGLKKLHEAMVEAANETAAFPASEAATPPVAAPADAPEFESPFADEVLPEGTEGVETQSDLRAFVGGGEETAAEAITQ